VLAPVRVRQNMQVRHVNEAKIHSRHRPPDPLRPR
jgi:hypothetical protein